MNICAADLLVEFLSDPDIRKIPTFSQLLLWIQQDLWYGRTKNYNTFPLKILHLYFHKDCIQYRLLLPPYHYFSHKFPRLSYFFISCSLLCHHVHPHLHLLHPHLHSLLCIHIPQFLVSDQTYPAHYQYEKYL